MAKSKATQWIPSGGVLAVAVGAAVVAAVLVNIYISHIQTRYEAGSEFFLQLARDVQEGKPIQATDLQQVRIPKPLLEAFSKAIKAGEKDSMVINKKARRKMYAGEFLFYPDFLSSTGAEKFEPPPQGYEMLTIPIRPEPLLQPGAYVTIRGRFDIDPDPKKEKIEVMDVLYNVQVKAVGGSAEAMEERRKAADNIQITLKQSQVKQLQQIQQSLMSKEFEVSLSASPEGVALGEPKFGPDILSLIETGKVPAGEAAP